MFLIEIKIQSKDNSFADQQLRFLDLVDELSGLFGVTSNSIEKGEKSATGYLYFKASDPNHLRCHLTRMRYEVTKLTDLSSGRFLPINRKQRRKVRRQKKNHRHPRRVAAE